MCYKVIFQDYLSDRHVKAVRGLLEGLVGVRVLDDCRYYMIIEVVDSMVGVIEDMNLCDYLTAVRR